MPRNNTSFPAQMTAALRALHARYLAARADAADPDFPWAHQLRYYQWVVRAVFSDPRFGLGSDDAGTADARGLLCYHSMGLGKTRLAVGVALALRAVRPTVVLLPRSLRANFERTVAEVAAAAGMSAAEAAAAAANISYVSMDAYNTAEQVARGPDVALGRRAAGAPAAMPSPAARLGGLDNKLLIVDEAHNFFRAIINGGPDSNARRVYDIVMAARNLRILFLTGTPAAKDPFELVPCFNMLAGFDLLPPQYDTFYDLYVDKGANAVKNRDHFANRILGLVSHVSTVRATEPASANASELAQASESQSQTQTQTQTQGGNLELELKDAHPETRWDLPKLWAMAAELPSFDVPAAAFNEVLRSPAWDGPRGPATVSPFAVVTDPAAHPQEHARIATADLKWPVVLAGAPGSLPPADGAPADGAPVAVVDGLHRIARAVLIDNTPTVRVVYAGPEVLLAALAPSAPARATAVEARASAEVEAQTQETIIEQAQRLRLLIADSVEEFVPGSQSFTCDFKPPAGVLWLLPPGARDWGGGTAGAGVQSVRAYDIDARQLRRVDSAEAVELFTEEFGCNITQDGKPTKLTFHGIDWAAVAARYSGVAFDPYNPYWVPPIAKPGKPAGATDWYHLIDEPRYFVWGAAAIRGSRVLRAPAPALPPNPPNPQALRAPRADGWFPAELPTVIERVPMGPYQYRQYLLAREREDAEGGGGGAAAGLGAVLAAAPLSLPGAEKKAARSYYVRSRSLGNFTLPRGAASLGAAPAAELDDALAPKLALIARRAAAAPGPVLAYSQFVESGLLPLARYLEKAGFRRWGGLAARPGGLAARSGAPPAAQPAENFGKIGGAAAAAARLTGAAAAAARLTGAGGPFAGTYSAAERALIIAAADARPRIGADSSRVGTNAPPVGAWYDPAAPIAAPYVESRPANAAFAFNLHHGQRKLFVGELQALTHLISSSALHSSEDGARARLTVLYAGAAPGHHIPLLARLFPGVTWHLYDPSEFRMAGSAAELGRIHAHREFFTDETARAWAGRCDVFFSDIRLNTEEGKTDPATGWSQGFEDQVAVDMAAQARWTELARPRLGASLKWRPPYPKAGSKTHLFDYLRGRVLVQTWPSRSSTEGRLVVTGADAAAGARATYDAVHYQDVCAQRNTVDRPWATYATLLTPGGADAPPGFDGCFDCANEEAAWRAYAALPHAVAARAPSVSHGASSAPHGASSASNAPRATHGAPRAANPLARAVCAHMEALTAATRQRLDPGARAAPAEVAARFAARARHGPALHGFAAALPAALRFEAAFASEGRKVGGSEDVAFDPADPADATATAVANATATVAEAPSYAIISGEVPAEERVAIVAAFNSRENAHGAVIKAILVSKTGAEGLDLKWIRETHQVEPYWDRARDDQVRARAVRVGSHDGLPAGEREVRPYLYIAVANPEVWKATPAAAREPSTIDELFYARATQRYQLNCAFREVLAEACLECELFGYSALGAPAAGAPGAPAAGAPAAAAFAAFACRSCAPTNAQLWLPDPAADARAADACRPRAARTVEAAPVELRGVTYYYQEDPASPFGYTFFEMRADLGAYAPIDISDIRLPELVRAVI